MELKITIDLSPQVQSLAAAVLGALGVGVAGHAPTASGLQPATTPKEAGAASATTGAGVAGHAPTASGHAGATGHAPTAAATTASGWAAEAALAPVDERLALPGSATVTAADVRAAMDRCRERLFGTPDKEKVDATVWKALNGEFLAQAKLLGNCKPSELTGMDAVLFMDVCQRIERREDGSLWIKEGEAPF